jgi:hypothetical protein
LRNHIQFEAMFFSNFIIGNMPVLLFEEELKKEKLNSLGRKRKTGEQPLDIDWKFTTDYANKEGDMTMMGTYKDQEGIVTSKTNITDKEGGTYKPKEWKYLYQYSFKEI